ncbi:MAG: protein kinase, partial [bacterium]
MTEDVKEQVGDYELLELIGDGAQGRVYKARYLGAPTAEMSADDIVAVKLIRITGDDEKLRSKFKAQADILRRLSHTNIVRYRDSFAWHSGEWDEAQCLAMEFLEGETLTDRLKKALTGLPWPEVETVFEQCLAGLIHARERGITHRDLKPSNIFITKDGLAKVIDFDIARQDEGGQMSTAGWKGTFDYMAPDFITISGFRGDEASDIFSLGVCFYQALTGSLPFESLGDSAHIGYLNRWKDGAAPSPSFRPGVFRVLSNAKPFVARCLAAKREQRYASFAAMLEDFRKIRPRRIRHKNKDEYELLGVLGRGGFGEVFKARRISDGALVAVKHLFAEKQSERFIKEAKILQQYPHPNLVKYYDFMIV